jgi:predicted peroxiredoxin
MGQVLRDMNMGEFAGKNEHKVKLYGDNQGAIALTKNPHLHERSKHIDTCYHFIRDLVEKGLVDVEYVLTMEMVADGMTKPLERIAFG